MVIPITATTALANTANLKKMQRNYACSYPHVILTNPVTSAVEYEGPGDVASLSPVLVSFCMIAMTQKGKTVNSGGLRAIDAYMLSKVPRQTFHNNPQNTLDDASDRTLAKYQRPLAPKKRANLTTWFGAAGMNYLATSSLLWIPELRAATSNHDATNLKDQGYGYKMRLTNLTNMGSELWEVNIPVVDDSTAPPDAICIRVKRVCSHPTVTTPPTPFALTDNSWFDYCPVCSWNGKPAEIIDGQHRVSGTGLSTNREQLIPCNFTFGDDFPSAEKAKLFSEVTVQATSLHELHAINLVYRSSPRGDHPKMKFFSEPNRAMLYEAALTMTASGVLENRIYALPNEKLKKPKGSMASISQIVDWMYDSDLIGAMNATNSSGFATATRISETVCNWFEAIENTAAVSWAGAATWNRSRGGRRSSIGSLNKTPPTEVFVKLLPYIIRHYGISGIVGVSDFQIASTQISQIDIQDGSKYRVMSQRGQANIRNLVYLLSSLISDIGVVPGPAGVTISASRPPPTAASWITGPISTVVDDFSLSASLMTVGSRISRSNVFTISWEVDLHDLVNTKPKGPLNSFDRIPTLKISDSRGNIYFNKTLEPLTMSKIFNAPLTDLNTGITATPGTTVNIELTYGHVDTISPPVTETMTFVL